MKSWVAAAIATWRREQSQSGPATTADYAGFAGIEYATTGSAGDRQEKVGEPGNNTTDSRGDRVEAD